MRAHLIVGTSKKRAGWLASRYMWGLETGFDPMAWLASMKSEEDHLLRERAVSSG